MREEEVIEIFFYILLVFFLWYILGCVVLASIDDKEQSLLKWATTAPNDLVYLLLVWVWPIVVYFWCRKRGNSKNH